MTSVDKVQRAIDLIQKAKELMDEVMDVCYGDSQISNEYYNYGQFGIQQALGEGNPYDGSLIKIRDNLIEDGEV
jgi:hypothetical protein